MTAEPYAAEAEPPVSANDVAEAPPGLSPFVGRRLDLGVGAAIADDDRKMLTPYTEIAPGVFVGFEANSGARVCVSRSEEAGALRLEVEQVARTRWLTIETEIGGQELLETGVALWSLTASCTPRAKCRLGLRLWRCEAGQFEDIHVGDMAIRPESMQIAEVVRVSADKLSGMPAQPNPRFLLFLPLHEAAYVMRSLTVTPASDCGWRRSAAPN